MKNFLLIAFICIGSTVYSQQDNYRISNFYEGYIIKKDGSKESGYIMYQDESVMYEKVIFKKDKKGKKERFKPKDIGGYKVADKTFHSVKYEAIPFKSEKFLLLEKEGCLNQYSFRQLNDGAWDTEMILKNDDKAISTQKFLLGFSKKMSDLLTENKEIAAKVRNKENGYSLFEIEAIVDEYNAACTTKS